MKTYSFSLKFNTAAALLFSCILIGAAGCASNRPPPLSDIAGVPPGEGGPQMMPIPHMQAEGEFFAGTLGVEVHFGPAARPNRDGGPGAAPDSNSKPGGKPPAGGGGGGMKMSGGSGGPRGGSSGGPRGEGPGGGGSGPGGGGGDSDERRMNLRAENRPATQLRLVLKNRTKDEVVAEVIDFDSALGNFAVKPDKITVGAGATAEADPMTSRLGVPTDDLPVRIRLRMGSRTDEQTVILKPTAANPEM